VVATILGSELTLCSQGVCGGEDHGHKWMRSGRMHAEGVMDMVQAYISRILNVVQGAVCMHCSAIWEEWYSGLLL